MEPCVVCPFLWSLRLQLLPRNTALARSMLPLSKAPLEVSDQMLCRQTASRRPLIPWW